MSFVSVHSHFVIMPTKVTVKSTVEYAAELAAEPATKFAVESSGAQMAA